MAKDNQFRTSIGGQALIEGIMMMGPKKKAIVVRGPEGLVTQVEDRKFIKDKYPILGWPFIRGVVNFGSSMVNGVKALMFSADYYPEEEGVEPEKPSKIDLWLEEHLEEEKAQQAIIYIAVFLGIMFSVGLFILLPTLLAGFVSPWIGSGVLRNLVEGAIRITLFVIYMIAVSRMKDMKRVFSYHGAEHKTIACYEAGLPLTVENVRQQTRFHPRCGTSFLFVVMIISILVFSVVRWSNPFIRMALRLALLPVVVGISYEINRFVGRHDNKFTRALVAPGLWFQRFTTNEPDDSMIEVGIEAVKLVLPEVEGEDEW
ncbi:MAG: DUF1385 domain-containing protein [Ruminococcaceae bacterium]|nr:DUF1385 domain-containing protein [Oscillospiraceae bacterium]